MGKKHERAAPDIEEEESDEEVALDEDDFEGDVLDDDVAPKQKVQIDNTVRLVSHCIRLAVRSYPIKSGRPASNTRDNSTRSVITMDGNVSGLFSGNNPSGRRR